jgi:Flp pilus assembly protein TadG
VLPIVLTLVLGMFDFCRAIMMRQLLTNAAREGARQAVTNTSNMSTAGVQAVVTYAMGGQSFSNVTILVYQANAVTGANIGPWASAPTGSSIAVDVTATYTPMLSLFSLLPKTISMHTRAIMTSEAI